MPYYRTDPCKVNYCIHSLISQSYKNLEILVIDDGSGKEFEQTLKEIAAMDSRIKIEHLEKNSGLSAARNYGLSICRGEYVIFVDSDDMLNYSAIEKLLTALHETKTDMAIGELAVINDYTTADVHMTYSKKIDSFNTLESLENLVINRGFGSTACGRLARKEIWYHQGMKPFIEGILHEDLAAVWKVISRCSTVSWIRGNYYYYYQGENSDIHTKKIPVKFCKDFIDALEYRNNSLLEEYKELAGAVAFSYLINCPLIYMYASMLSADEEKKRYKMWAKTLFYKNFKEGIRYPSIKKKQYIKILLFRIHPVLYVGLHKTIRKIKRMRY